MPKFRVDVKAFINVEVEAANAAQARRIADDYVENISPGEGYIGGYNDGLATTGERGRIISDTGLGVDGTSEVERVCSECDDVIDCPSAEERRTGICDICAPEPPEPPLDTPSLDTSFHDHEMDV